ncbi:hypothetical protein KCV06_g381, partial [Aureobasidium melanogenum]
MGEDKGQDFKLEAPCLFPLARPEQKMAEVPIWLMSGGPRRSAKWKCGSKEQVKIGIQGLDIFIFDLLFFSIVVIVEAFLFVGLSGCFAHTSSSPGEAFSRIDCHQLQGRDLSPFVHIHQFLDNTSVVWVNQVQSLRTNLAESGNRSTDDKVLLVSEQGGEVFGDLRKRERYPDLPRHDVANMSRRAALSMSTDFNDTAQAFEDFPFVPAVQ